MAWDTEAKVSIPVGMTMAEYVARLEKLNASLKKENDDLRSQETRLANKVAYYEKNYVPKGVRGIVGQ